MAKTILGIDIGHDQLKLALVRKNKVLKVATAEMPQQLLRDGRIVSWESMGELVRHTMKEHGMRAKDAAVVVPNESVYIKNVEMPIMSIEQLQYNLPFEFNDYITGEQSEYIFDYALLSELPDTSKKEKEKGKKEKKKKEKVVKKRRGKGKDEEVEANGEDAPRETGLIFPPNEAEPSEANAEEAPATMELMAVCCQKTVLEDAQGFTDKASLKLKICTPTVCTYIALIRHQLESVLKESPEIGILDLGYGAVRMFMFHRDKEVASRSLEVGLSTVDDVLADAYGVDVHLAHTYLVTNFEDCQRRAECMAAYENIAVELMRALNFYRFSNPNNSLTDIWLCGGGAVIEPLVTTIGDMIGIQLHRAEELVPGGESIESCNNYVQAIGVTMV
ncbi:MAG: pilus assembly protein PilM [Blautia sp.]|nr:pilus assembly protein PilM [Blautia sp.]